MFKDKMTMLILSCDSFSDLWDGHVKLLEENWPDREMDTYILTESVSDKSYEHVKVFDAGLDKEWSERLEAILATVDTEYVFVTLDDYFLIEKVNNVNIEYLLSMAEKCQLDYIRLFPRPKRATRGKLTGSDSLKWIATEEKYSVNLYSGIWKTKFLKAMLGKKKNAWQFEVGLSKSATAYGAKCAVSLNNDFVILDVVRKGKLLHNSAAYFKKHPGIYNGNREIQTWSYEIKLWIKTMVGRHTPKFLYNYIRSVMKKFGYHFISDEVE